ncbi:MAG: serine/threonine-protein kinase [Byssovorax sp.]
MQLAAGLVIADRFRLVRPLGQGGMGAVWLAQHTGLDVPCAVKFIHEEAAKSAELRARFEREAKAAAQLRSPHVVQILDHGVWGGAPYIAMELLEGEDLGQRLKKRRPLSARETLVIATQVGRALSKAHAAGLVHRDLKPANIFLVRDDEREIAKVLDFGVAKVKETGLDDATQTGAVLGTPFYMSPEQARGSKSIDHRSDLWALAVVVYQCMIGKLPFRGDALGDLLVKIIIDPLPVPSAAGPVPPGFDAWWERAAAREPADRYQTPKEMTQALGLALGLTLPDNVDGMATSPGAILDAPIPAGPLPRSHEGRTVAFPVEIEAPTVALPSSASTSQSGQVSFAVAPTHQTVNVAPPPARVGLTVAAIVGAVAVGSLGTFLAVRSGQPADARSSASAAPVAAGTTAPVVAPVVTTTPAASSAATAASATSASTVTSAPVVSASASPKSSPVVGKPAGNAGPRPKTDFGF